MARSTHRSPVVAFMLIIAFGILFAGCKGPGDIPDDSYVFTDEDAARFQQLVQQAASGGSLPSTRTASGSMQPYLEPLPTASGATTDSVALDLSMVDTYKAIRAGGMATGSEDNAYQVTNEFLNMRAEPSVASATIVQLSRGDTVYVKDFTNSRWAEVEAGGKKGFVSIDYIARSTSEEKLAEEKKKFDGLYYVNFQFVNMRKDKSQQSEKLGEIPGQTILKPKRIEPGWMLVEFDKKEGYVSTSYLQPFLPSFVVRQTGYELPILHYRLAKEGMIPVLTQHVQRLRADGYTVISMRAFYDLLLRQQQRDARLDPKTVVLGVSGVTGNNVKELSDALTAAGVYATLFVQTKDVGLTGITEKMMLTLMANGYDIQSASHTGDDLRALTNAQIELELRQSRQIIEEMTKKNVYAVAYPQGGVNDRVMEIAASAGYLIGISSTPDRTFTRDQLLRLPSYEIFPTTTADEVVRMVSGS